MKRMLIALGLVSFCGLAGAENLIKNGGAENDIDWFNGFSGKLTTLVKSGKNCYYVTGTKRITAKKLIAVESNKKYELSGWFKSAGDDSSKICFGLIAFDANKKKIKKTKPLFFVADKKIVPEIWTKFSGQVVGGKLPAGTKFVKVILVGNYKSPKGRLAVDDLEFKAVK